MATTTTDNRPTTPCYPQDFQKGDRIRLPFGWVTVTGDPVTHGPWVAVETDGVVSYFYGTRSQTFDRAARVGDRVQVRVHDTLAMDGAGLIMFGTVTNECTGIEVRPHDDIDLDCVAIQIDGDVPDLGLVAGSTMLFSLNRNDITILAEED